MKNLILATSFLLLLVSQGLQAQVQEPVKIEKTVSVSNDTVSVKINFVIEDNWMVYDSLSADVGPFPVSFNYDGVQNLEFLGLKKPHTKKKYDDIFEVDLWYITEGGTYEVKFKIVNKDIDPIGFITMEYMCCNLTSGVCLPPKVESISVKLK